MVNEHRPIRILVEEWNGFLSVLTLEHLSTDQFEGRAVEIIDGSELCHRGGCEWCDRLRYLSEDRFTLVCRGCGKVLDQDNDDYIAFKGNVTRGWTGGIIGPNLTQQNRLKNVSVWCMDCRLVLLNYLGDMFELNAPPLKKPSYQFKRKLRIV